MHNPNFLPQKHVDKYNLKSVIRYKTIFLILWVVCVTLFLLFVINYDRYKNLTLITKDESNKKPEVVGKSKKNFQSITALKIFLDNLENEMPYESAEIEEKQIRLNLTAKDKEDFIKILDSVENKSGYKIVFLSPVEDKAEEKRFQLFLEK
jgi:hypothetical protein